MRKHRLDMEDLRVQSLVTGTDAPAALFNYTTMTLTNTVIEPGFTDMCIPSQETCNCVTHPWC